MTTRIATFRSYTLAAFFVLVSIVAFLGLSTTTVEAQTILNSELTGQITSTTDLSNDRTPVETASIIIGAVLNALGIISVGLILYAGFQWMTARGNPDQAQKAQATLRMAVIGLVIIMASYGIALFVFSQIESATDFRGNDVGTTES